MIRLDYFTLFSNLRCAIQTEALLVDYCPVHLLCHQLVRKVSLRIQNRELRS
jgi:hypothetical protein